MRSRFSASHGFFAQRPEPVRREALYTAAGNRGYVAMRGESLDPARPADLKEAFNIGLDLARTTRRVGRPALPGREPVAGTAGLAGIDADLFRCPVVGLGRHLHGALAADLGLAAGHFEDMLDRPMAMLRLLHYPPPGRGGGPDWAQANTPTTAT